MKTIRAWLMRLASIISRDRQEQDFAEEIESHLQLHIDDNIRSGMSTPEARRQAVIKLGGLEQTKEAYRDRRGVPFLEYLGQDLRYTTRMLRKSPGFTAVVVLTIGLGVGANTAIFGVVNAALLQPAPIRASDRVAVIWVNDPSHGRNRVGPDGKDYLDWRKQNTSFEDLFLFEHGSGTITGAGEPEQAAGLRVTTNFADFLGFQPFLGRAFLPEEERGIHNVAMLSYEYWQRRFGSDSNVIGRAFTLNGESYTIIGVVPPKVWTWFPADVIVPFSVERLQRVDSNLGVFGRLKPGLTFKQAEFDMSAIAGRVGEARPDSRKGWGVTIVPLKDVMVEYIRPALLILLAAVGLVLLIACANVANLLLARAVARQREVAIRIAMGASRLRLAQQFLTESIVLALSGGAAGLLFAFWGAALLYRVIPASIPVPEAAAQVGLPRGRIDALALCFTLAVSLVVGILFGLAPVLQCLGGKPADALKDGVRAGTQGIGANRSRAALVICETGLAVVLVIGAGLMIRTFWRLLAVKPGFEPDNVVSLQIKLADDLVNSPYREPRGRAAAFKRFLEQVQGVPAVESAALAELIPLSHDDQDVGGFVIKEQPMDSSGESFTANFRPVSPSYFGAMRIPLLAGRTFSDYDDLDRQRVVIVDETLARRFFGNTNPIGSHLQIPDSSRPAREVVGVVGSVLDDGLDKQPTATIYLPYLQAPSQTMSLLIRTSVRPGVIVPQVKSAIWTVDRNQPAFNVRTLNDIASNTVSAERVAFALLAVFASIALALAVVGIYGVISYSVSKRTHEIGLRVALGADRVDVMKLVLIQGMSLAGAGVAVGLIAALGLSHLMSSLLYGVQPTDPATFAGVGAGLLVVALLANCIPARRAASVSPMVALRYE